MTRHRKARARRPILHRGLHYGRVKRSKMRWADDPTSRREYAFAELWEEENVPTPGRNAGEGYLQDLMLTYRDASTVCHTRTPFGIFDGRRWAFRIHRREAAIVATVIQWLGSNCGFCFLSTALRRAGYEVVERQELERLRERAFAQRSA